MISRRRFIKGLAAGSLGLLGSLPALAWQRKSIIQDIAPQNSAASYGSRPVRVTRVLDQGGRVDWLPRPGGDVLFDRCDNNGYFSLWMSDSGFRQFRSLTRDIPDFAGRHVGQPAWHPDGEWMVFQAQKAGVPEKFHKLCTPGAGWRNDLWMIHRSGKQMALVHDVGGGGWGPGGTLHPHFSHAGDRLTWAERVGPGGAHGSWVIKVARLMRGRNGAPLLENIRTYAPFGTKSMFYETHGFDAQDQSIIFTITANDGYQIARMDLSSGKAWLLTNDQSVWNEHAQVSPDGQRIVYMSSRGLTYRKFLFKLETEFWMMDMNGGNQQRLTSFHDRSSNHYIPGIAIPADSAWRWDGRAFLGFVVNSQPGADTRDSGSLYLVELA